MKPPITVEPVTEPTEEVVSLVAALEAGLAASYAPEQRHGLSLDALFQPHIRFFLARRDGTAVGCGGLALFPGFGEVKRMYVTEQARCTGVARRLLDRIEAEARTAGLPWLRLETGDAQHAAMTVYQRAGFHRCEAFGPYADMPPAAVATSVFFEKPLTPSSPSPSPSGRGPG